MKTGICNARTLFSMWLLACCAQVGALAQTSVMIWPLDPVIEEDQRATAIWLENRGTETVSMQIRVLSWTQNNREDGYEPQDQVLASQPIAEIGPGQRQLVRLMNTRPAPEGKEVAYRVLVDELPSTATAANPDRAAQGSGSGMGIKLQIRYSIPLFVSGKGNWFKPRADRKRDPATAAQPVLNWRTERDDSGYYLVVGNSGNAHARLTAAQWVRGDETKLINAGLLGYVLPGALMRWRLENPPPAGFAPQARVNGGSAPVVFAAQ